MSPESPESTDSPEPRGASAGLIARGRLALLATGAVVVLAALLPPLGIYSREHVFSETLQFLALGYVAPPLLVLGLPAAARAQLAGHWTTRDGRSRPRAWIAVAAFVVVAIGWRLPTSVDALHSAPLLSLLEAATLLAAGGALWLELTDSSLATTVSRGPKRMAMAALVMWSIWVDGYALGFSGGTWYGAFPHHQGGLGVIADQEIACWILWVVPGICLVPVFFSELIGWLHREAGDPITDRFGTLLTRFGPPGSRSRGAPGGGHVGGTPHRASPQPSRRRPNLCQGGQCRRGV
ncbi:MAG: cytochrome c oxidase assembly protein, partial [Acidimicrobiales bacterium]